MKLFGRELFTFKKEPGVMYDFAQHGILDVRSMGLMEFDGIAMEQTVAATPRRGRPPKQVKPPVEKPKLTPKQVMELKSLNDNNFHIRRDEEYLAEQLRIVAEKIEFLGKKPKARKTRRSPNFGIPEPESYESGSIKFGRDELESIQERLLNRRRLDEFKGILEKYPHTSSALIGKVLSEHSHLRANTAGQFVPDFPTDAIKSMKEYDEMCISLCNKKAVFYVIAQNKDFQRVAARRDPILLAQSPFGHFWQILGAWDDEMIYLGDL